MSDLARRLGGFDNDSILPSDEGRITRAVDLVRHLLSDQLWHTGRELLGLRVEDPKRRVRQLREEGYEIEARRINDETMGWEYRWTGKIGEATTQERDDMKCTSATFRIQTPKHGYFVVEFLSYCEVVIVTHHGDSHEFPNPAKRGNLKPCVSHCIRVINRVLEKEKATP